MSAIFQFFLNAWCWYSISIDTGKTGDPNFFGGRGNFSIWSIFKKWQPFFNFFIIAKADISFPLILRKLETQTLWGVSNLKFFHMINIYEMVAIFQFFHNGQCWYSISVDTWKTGDPNFGGVLNFKFFRMIDIYIMVTILKFFHNGWHWYSVSINTQKTRNPNFWGSGIWIFVYDWYLHNCSHF